MASTLSGTKYCCKCGTDVTAKKRMRDSGGKYWCVPCGQKDQQSKAANTGMTCASCGEMYPSGQLTQMSGASYCAPCMKAKFKNSGGGGGLSALFDIKRYFPSGGDDNEDDGGRKKKLTVMLVVLVVLIVAVNYWAH